MSITTGRQILPTGGKEFRGVAGAVQDLYELYPYPQFRQLFIYPDLADSLAYLAHRCSGGRRFQPGRVLVAGCGTTHAVSIAASLPTAAVLGIDISQRSLEIAARMAEDLRLTNLELRQEDLLDFTGREGHFDLIDCYGVLHHTADPLRGLQNLARALAPDGLMSIMLYSQRVRREIGEFQRVLEMLEAARGDREADGSLEARMELAHRLAQALAASDSRLRRIGQKAAGMFQEDRTRFADTYVQPREVRYTLDEVLALLRTASLDLVNFVHEQEWKPQAYLDDPDLVRRLQQLPRIDRWRFCDAAGSPFYHFLCAHSAQAARPLRPCLASDALLLDVVPHASRVHSYPLHNNRIRGPAAREPREGVTFVRRDQRIRFRGSLGELETPAIVLDYLRLADGRRSLREIAATAAFHHGLATAPPSGEVAKAVRALFGMIPFLTPDPAHCRGCPGGTPGDHCSLAEAAGRA